MSWLSCLPCGNNPPNPPTPTPQGMSEDDIEVVLDKGIMLFRYLQEKDVFEKYYKQHLAKRLLHGRSSSEDAGARSSACCGLPRSSGACGRGAGCRPQSAVRHLRGTRPAGCASE